MGACSAWKSFASSSAVSFVLSIQKLSSTSDSDIRSSILVLASASIIVSNSSMLTAFGLLGEKSCVFASLTRFVGILALSSKVARFELRLGMLISEEPSESLIMDCIEDALEDSGRASFVGENKGLLERWRISSFQSLRTVNTERSSSVAVKFMGLRTTCFFTVFSGLAFLQIRALLTGPGLGLQLSGWKNVSALCSVPRKAAGLGRSVMFANADDATAVLSTPERSSVVVLTRRNLAIADVICISM